MIGSLMQMMKCLTREIDLKEQSHEEALFHLFSLGIGLLQIVHRHAFFQVINIMDVDYHN